MQDVIRPAPQPNLSQPYLIEMMAKVSRSFAVVVAHLEAPLNYQLATAYLICRVVDNIEDCGQPAIWKQAKFEQFQRMLEEPVLAAEVLRQWQGEAWPGLTADETALMGLRKGLPLWQIFAALPDGARATIAHWAATMARGMWQMEEPGLSPLMVERAGVRLLTTEEEYNQYCYFVAGTVGHLGTELVVEHYGLAQTVATRLRESAESCGRGLQKTNIVKDFVKDHARQICYLPARWLDEVDYRPLKLSGATTLWTHKVIQDVVQELHQSLDHVLNVPHAARGYRIASLICLLPALHTLLLAAQHQALLFTPGHQIKVSRMTMLHCIQTAQALWQDDAAIVAHCRGLEAAIAGVLAGTPVEPSAVR
jgi:farnesyl-diphosphate farnesyltransferase